MSRKAKIIIAITGGAVVGALASCIAIWPSQALILGSSSTLVATVVAAVTGFAPTK